MLSVTVLHAFATVTMATPSLARDCFTTSNERCLSERDAGFPKGFHAFLTNDGPCFPFRGNDVCFYSTFPYVKSCDCSNAACQCPSTSGQALPTCSTDFSVPNCSAVTDVYCSLGNDNSACKYCGLSGKNCGQHCAVGLTDDEKALIVNTHNKLRSIVANGNENRSTIRGEGQPSAADMHALVWDDELAVVAQAFAGQCIFAHDANRQIPSAPNHRVGQNLAHGSISALTSDKRLEEFINAWYDEVACFPSGNVSPWRMVGTTCQTGHYTQVVWGATQRVGCGYIKYKSRSMYEELLVCNYYPAGNRLGKHVYTVGSAGSACPGTSPVSPNGLCANGEGRDIALR